MVLVQESICRRPRYLRLFFLLFFLTGVAVCTSPAEAAAAMVKVGSVYDATVGGTADVVIAVQNPSGMAGYQFELNYNPQIAVVKGFTKGTSLTGFEIIGNINGAAAGCVKIVGIDLTGQNQLSSDAELCRLTFDILSVGIQI